MIALDLPPPLLWALRWMLFLAPVGLAAWLGWRSRMDHRALVGGLFAFLYGLGLIFITHMIAIRLGWWHYGGDALMLQGMPVDVLVGGAILFGPVLYYAFPATGPFWVVIPIILGLHGTVFSSLKPLVYAGPYWPAGVVLVFAIAHIPAIYLARWTQRDVHLHYRVSLLAFGYGFLAFALLPSLVMHAMGGEWALEARPLWLLIAGAFAAAPFLVMGLSAVQLFAVHGEGTPIPLDNTKRLVRTGLFAYLINPMQLCTACVWIILGVVLGSVWVASAAIMAWVFVAGMVRWHHRNDLLVRFPVGWPVYRANVTEWFPRWRPWFASDATLIHDPENAGHRRLVRFLQRQGATGLTFQAHPAARLGYVEPDETRVFQGTAALSKALNHVNFAIAVVGAAGLLVALPLQYFLSSSNTSSSAAVPASQPRSVLFGLNHLLRIRRDQLVFYDELRASHGDVVRLRLGPYRSWLLFHPDQIEALLTRKWSSFIRFKRLTEVVAQWNGDSLLLAEEEEWRERRRKVLPAFQSRRLPFYGEKITEHAERFGCDLASKAASGTQVIDTDAAMARLTLDIATTTLFGAAPAVNGDEVEEALQILSDVAFVESTALFTLPDWLPLASKRRKKWAMAVMDKLVTGLVERGLARGSEDQGDLLSMLIEQHAGEPVAIRNDSMSLLIAGHETSGALLGWVFLCLVRHPEWLAVLKAEIDSTLGGKRPTVDDCAQLPNVRAVIEETLRLYPPAYSLFLRQATEDAEIAGVLIAKGDLVQIAPFALHHDARWFPEPDRFDPTRFLKEPTWPRYAYLPFGAGPRVCIGQNFALMEACLVIATLLQHVEPVTLEGSAPALSAKFSLRPQGGMRMTWRAR